MDAVHGDDLRKSSGPSKAMLDKGYRTSVEDRKNVYRDVESNIVVVETKESIRVLGDSNHYRAACELAKEKFGVVVETSSMNREFLITLLDVGIEVKHFRSPEQKQIYRSICDERLARSQESATRSSHKLIALRARSASESGKVSRTASA